MLDVSIIITAFNSSQYLDACIASIFKSIKHHSFEVIVVDDASIDNSAEHVADQYKDIRYIRNRINMGYVKSNNIGIMEAQGRYVMSLNNDTVVKEGSIDAMVDFLEAHPEAGAVGPKLTNCDGTLQLQCRRGFPTPLNALYYYLGLSQLFPKSKRFGGYLLHYIDGNNTAEVDCLCGAAMMVRREVIDRVGLMDQSYFMYGDDIDWCYRIKQAGYKVYYLPDAEVTHYGGRGGSKERSYRNIVEFHRSMAIFHKKHYSAQYFFMLNWLVYAGIWILCMTSLARNLLRKDKYVGTKKP